MAALSTIAIAQNAQIGRDLKRSSGQSFPWKGNPGEIIWPPVQPAIENSQWWRLHHVSGEVVPVNDCTYCKLFHSYIDMKPFLPGTWTHLALVKRKTPSSFFLPCKCWNTGTRCFLSLLFSRGNRTISLNFAMWGRLSSPLTTFVTLLWAVYLCLSWIVVSELGCALDAEWDGRSSVSVAPWIELRICFAFVAADVPCWLRLGCDPPGSPAPFGQAAPQPQNLVCAGLVGHVTPSAGLCTCLC